MSRRKRSKMGSEAQQLARMAAQPPEGIVPEGFTADGAAIEQNVRAYATRDMNAELKLDSVRESLRQQLESGTQAVPLVLGERPEPLFTRESMPARAAMSEPEPEMQQPQMETQTAPRAPTEKKMANGQQKRVWLDQVPMEHLAELSKSYSQVALKIHRFDPRQGLATIYARAMFAPAEIATIEAWLSMQSGGGSYPITVTAPDDPLVEICPGFVVKVEGPSRPPQPLDDAHVDPNAPIYEPSWDAGRDRAGTAAMYGSGGYAGNNAQYVRRDDREGVRQGYGQQSRYPGERPAPGATMASDALALRELDATRARLTQLEADNKRLLEQGAARERALEKQLAERERMAAEDRHRADMQRLSDQIAALKTEPRRGDDGGSSSSMKVLEILAPLVMAWLSESSKGQSNLMTTLLTRGRDADPFADLARIEPLITKLSGQKGQHDSASIVAKMTEGQIANAMMAAELVKSFAEDKLPEDSPGMKIVQQLVGSAASMGAAYFEQKAKEAEAEAQEKQLVAQRERNRALEADLASKRAQEARTSSPAPVRPATPAQTTPSAAATAAAASTGTLPPELATQMAMLPPAFQTPEWKKLLTELHLEKDGKPVHEAEEMGNYIAHYLEHLVMFGALPQELAGMLVDPQKTIDTVLGLMPVARKHPAYAKAVAIPVATVFARHAQPQPTAAAPQAAAVVTPAPTNGASTHLVTPPAEADEGEEDDDGTVTYPS